MSKNTIFSDTEYKNLIEEYLNDELVQALKNIPHHDSNRLDHSLKNIILTIKVLPKQGYYMTFILTE